MTKQYSDYLQKAIDEAKAGVKQQEGGPFGAAIIKEDKLIACCHNTVMRSHDATAHAEVNAIRAAGQKLGSYDLSGCTLITTSEPCPMCLAAILWANIKTVVVGADKKVAEKFGFRDVDFYQQLKGQQDKDCEMIYLNSEGEVETLFDYWQRLQGKIY